MSHALAALLSAGRSVREVADDVYSVLDDTRGAQYDRYARGYDLLVGNRLYNRIAWANSTSDYTVFARQALGTQYSGWHLDAGGGSLLFAADVYLATARPIVVFDRSLAMLRRARQRLVQRAGAMPSHITLLQGDLLDLPFRPAAFDTILSLYVLHHIADGASLLRGLDALRASQEHPLSFTTIVLSNRRVGNAYLRLLHGSGEFVPPRTAGDVRSIGSPALRGGCDVKERGSVVYVTSPARESRQRGADTILAS